MIFLHEPSGELVVLVEYSDDVIKFGYGDMFVIPLFTMVDELTFVGWL